MFHDEIISINHIINNHMTYPDECSFCRALCMGFFVIICGILSPIVLSQGCNKNFYVTCQYYDIVSVTITNYSYIQNTKYAFDVVTDQCSVQCLECIGDTYKSAFDKTQNLYPVGTKMKIYKNINKDTCVFNSGTETVSIIAFTLVMLFILGIIIFFLKHYLTKYISKRQIRINMNRLNNISETTRLL